MSLANTSHLSSTSVSSVALVSARRGESCPSSLTCTTKFPGHGSSPSPLVSLMRRPLTSPTSLVLWSRGIQLSPAVKDTLAVHLSLNSAPSFRPSRVGPPRLWSVSPTWWRNRQVRTALHTMAILQAYQAEVLKEMDEGEGVTLKAVKELCRATDLALRATKHTARPVGHSMAGLVMAERHLW